MVVRLVAYQCFRSSRVVPCADPCVLVHKESRVEEKPLKFRLQPIGQGHFGRALFGALPARRENEARIIDPRLCPLLVDIKNCNAATGAIPG